MFCAICRFYVVKQRKKNTIIGIFYGIAVMGSAEEFVRNLFSYVFGLIEI